MPLLGKNAAAYLSDTALNGTSNTAETVTWTEQGNLTDETDNFTSEDIDITTRATAKSGWQAYASGPKSGEVTFTSMMEPGDSLADALMQAFLNSTPIAMLFLSGPIDSDGSFGLAANWTVSCRFPRPVKGVQTIEVTLKIYSHPEWCIVSGSSLEIQ